MPVLTQMQVKHSKRLLMSDLELHLRHYYVYQLKCTIMLMGERDQIEA